MEQIVLLHTNDLHSHLENWPKIRRFLQQRKQEYQDKGATVITVDLGDFSDRWHPLTEATNGKANIRLMNTAGYDAATIGNNEGVGNAKKDLDQLYTEAEFPVIVGNLFDQKTLAVPSWAQQYKLIETSQGTKIGLIAFTAPFPLTYSPNGWDIREPLELLPDLINFLRPQVNVLVLLSHLGIESDFVIANDLPEIDVILGAHTHHLFPDGKLRGNVQLAAAGKYGRYVGEVLLEVAEDKRIATTSAHAYPTEEMLALPEDEAEISGYLLEGHALLQAKKIARLPHDLTLTVADDWSMIQMTLEAVKEKAATQVAILNSGLFLEKVPRGIVNHDQLHTSLPHPMHLIRVSLTGSDMIRLVLEMEKNRGFLSVFPIVGMGFRGKIFGQIVYSGIQYDAINHQVLWLGKPIDPAKEYTFATVDHFMFVPFFPTIEIAGRYEFLFPEFIRQVLGTYLSTHYPIQ